MKILECFAEVSKTLWEGLTPDKKCSYNTFNVNLNKLSNNKLTKLSWRIDNKIRFIQINTTTRILKK